MLDGVPDVSRGDSITYRIEALRVYIEKMMGDEPFIQAYRYFLDDARNDEDDDDDDVLEEIVPEDKREFVTLIHQLIVCEDSVYK